MPWGPHSIVTSSASIQRILHFVRFIYLFFSFFFFFFLLIKRRHLKLLIYETGRKFPALISQRWGQRSSATLFIGLWRFISRNWLELRRDWDFYNRPGAFVAIRSASLLDNVTLIDTKPVNLFEYSSSYSFKIISFELKLWNQHTQVQWSPFSAGFWLFCIDFVNHWPVGWISPKTVHPKSSTLIWITKFLFISRHLWRIL